MLEEKHLGGDINFVDFKLKIGPIFKKEVNSKSRKIQMKICWYFIPSDNFSQQLFNKKVHFFKVPLK